MENNTVEVWVACNNTYQRALAIPFKTCMDFAIFPLAWLSYLGFSVSGRRGHISNSPDGPEIEYRPTESPVVTPGIYYYIAGGLDPLWLDAMNDRILYKPARIFTSQQDFKEKVIERDETCVITGSTSRYCEPWQIIPQSRRNQYIVDLASKGGIVDPPLDGVDDTRNGLLLQVSIHRSLDDSRIAFLRTPNHAMDVTDVRHVTQLNSVGIPYDVRERLTLQHFDDTSPVVVAVAPHNCDARISESADWPPDVLFDVAYGCAALKAWGDPEFMAIIKKCRGPGRGRTARRGRGRGRRGRGRGGAERAKAKDQEGDRDVT